MRVRTLPAELAGLVGRREALVALGPRIARSRSMRRCSAASMRKVVRGSRRSGDLSRAVEPAGAPGVLGAADAVSDVWRTPAAACLDAITTRSPATTRRWLSCGARRETTGLVAAFVDVFLRHLKPPRLHGICRMQRPEAYRRRARRRRDPVTRMVDARNRELDVRANSPPVRAPEARGPSL